MLATIRKIYYFSGKQKKELNKAILFQIVNSIFEMMQFYALFLVMQGITEGEVSSIMRTTFFIMLISVLGKGISNYIANLGQTKTGYFMAAEKRIHIGNRLKYMPMGYFNNNSLGNITSAVTTILSDVENAAPMILATVVHGFIYTIVITCMITAFNPSIGGIVIAGILLFLANNIMLQKKTYKDSPIRQARQAKLVETTLEYIQGMSVVKSFNLNRSTEKKIDKAIVESEQGNLAIEKACIPYIALGQLILKAVSVIVMYVSILLFLDKRMELSECILMLVASFSIFAKLEAAGSVSSLMRLLDASMVRANDIDNTPMMDIDGRNVAPKNFNIEFNNVSFSYDKKKILENINLHIPENTTTAIVGTSGSGKSTLCNLIARFWDVNEGNITLGGTDIREYTLDSLLANISMVFQNVYLFNDSIANNIRFGKANAPMKEVIEAAKKACCHEFIMNLPKGYDTVIGEAGATVSGGEKQRISIARAILKDSPIIILDEATANVDPENESKLQDAIEELTRNKTIIMIAHRLKTVRNAQQIIVIDEGKIVQKGTHDELINQKGIYADFIGVRKKAIGWKIHRG